MRWLPIAFIGAAMALAGLLVVWELTSSGDTEQAINVRHPVATSVVPPRTVETRVGRGKASADATATPSPDERLVASLPLDVKIGQMIMAGFYGTTADQGAVNLVQSYHLGNVVIFDRNVQNPRQLLALTKNLQQTAVLENQQIGMLIAVDQEGGEITRLDAPAGFTTFPSAVTFGCIGDSALVRSAARVLGSEMRAVGINIDLAPVLDVNDNPANPVIGSRSFGADPNLVANLGSAFVAGLHDAGVIATAKHFPGHGNTGLDSHEVLPVVTKSRPELESAELLPFENAIAHAGVDSIMTAHVLYPALDPERPATLSSAIIDGLLRQDLSFKNEVVISDSMTMGAITNTWGVGEAAVYAVEAGVDIIALASPEHVGTVYESLLGAVREGRISEARIDASVKRIVGLKIRYGVGTQDRTDLGIIGSSPHGAVVNQVAEAATRKGCR